MKKLILITLAVYFFIVSSCRTGTGEDEKLYSGNPLFTGWYADPEGEIIDGEYWIFPTWSDRYGDSIASVSFSEYQLRKRENAINKQYLKQTFLDAFSSTDFSKPS